MQCLEALFEMPGIGGAVACAAVVALVACYGLTVRWISKGRQDKTEGR